MNEDIVNQSLQDDGWCRDETQDDQELVMKNMPAPKKKRSLTGSAQSVEEAESRLRSSEQLRDHPTEMAQVYIAFHHHPSANEYTRNPGTE